MPYDNQQTYAKFNTGDCKECGEHSHEHSHSHSSEGCGCEDKSCGCCPKGLVSVSDKDGVNIGCLSPADAQEYMAKTFRCPDGYIRVLAPITFEFIGCLTPEDYAVYKASLV